MNDYWLSSNTYVGPEGVGRANGCIISIVLEGKAHHHFSGIRLLIVHKPSNLLDQVEISECLDTAWFGFRSKAKISHREALSMHWSRTTEGNRDFPPGNARSICNVVFELVDRTDERYHACELRLCSQSRVEDVKDMRVAYSHVYHCTPANMSIHVALNTSHPFWPVPILAIPTYDASRHTSGIFSHSVRVVPTSGRQKQRPLFPPEVLCQIIKLAIGEKSTGWRAELLEYGLVCKAWAHVLDLAVGGFDEITDQDKPGVLAVARALDSRPQRGAIIRIFDPTIYEYHLQPSGAINLNKWRAILTILIHSTSVEAVRLSSFHPSLSRELLGRLQTLRNVQTCRIQPPNPRNKLLRGGYVLTVGDVQAVIASWGRLRSLEMYDWRDNDTQHSPPPSRLECNLQKLTLNNGMLHGSQLMLFVSSGAPCLKELQLKGIRGVRNNDLHAFLEMVAPTLSSLIVYGCVFDRVGDSEEHAIDAAMPNMTTLETLSADCHCISALAIARRSSTTPLTGTLHGSININCSENPGLTLQKLAMAMDSTAWGVIRVRWVPGDAWSPWRDSALVEKIKRVANERGIVLDCKMQR